MALQVPIKALLLLAGALQAVAGDSSCYHALGGAFPKEVFFPGGSNNTKYTELNHRYTARAILNPSCIFQPTSVTHLARGVKALASGRCQFAIKAGGHNLVRGANDIDNGVSINLGLLNSTFLSADRTYVSLGAGGSWGAAYAKFEAEGIVFPGGVCETTGVGGLSIGGGDSYAPAKDGWTVDNVLNYEVVLASGEIVNANQTVNSDLYKALKGGGSNFGIVTRADVASYAAGDFWSGFITVPRTPEIVKTTLKAITTFTVQNNVDLNVNAQVIFRYDNVATNIVYVITSVDGTVNPPSLQPFTSVQPQLFNNVALRSMSEIAQMNNESPSPHRDATATFTFVNDYNTISAIQKVSDEIYASIKDRVPNMDFVYFFIPSPRIRETYSTARGGNVLGLDDRDRDLMLAFFTPRWLDAAYDDIMLETVKRWVEETTKVTKKLGTGDPFIYHNHAAGFQKPLCGYGRDNVRFMQKVSAKYDPTGVFQKLVPGGFKVSRAC